MVSGRFIDEFAVSSLERRTYLSDTSFQAGSTAEENTSVLEMTHAGEDHSQAQAVSRGDDFGVFYGATRLNNRGCTSLRGFFHAVRKWEKRVGGYCSALQRSLRFHHGDFYGIDAAHLSGA